MTSAGRAMPPFSSLGPRSFGVLNLRGTWTLLRRQALRHTGFWVESLGAPVVSNLLFLAVFVLARGDSLGRIWPEVDIASFIAPGLIVFGFSHSAFETNGAYVVFDKLEGMIGDVLAAPLTAFELVIGWVLGAALAGLVTGGVVALVFLPFVDWPVFDPLLVFGFALLGALLFALLGLLVGLWGRRWDHYSAAESFLVLPLALLSGTFYLREALPPLGQHLLAINPVFHLIDGFRAGLVGRADADPAWGALYLAGLILVLALLAWRLVARGWHLKS